MCHPVLKSTTRNRLSEIEDGRRLLYNMTSGTATATATTNATSAVYNSSATLQVFGKDFEERLTDCGCGGGGLERVEEGGGLKSR